jgi:hypothetical protein
MYCMANTMYNHVFTVDANMVMLSNANGVLKYRLYEHDVCCDASKDGEQEREIEIEETKCSEFYLALEELLGKSRSSATVSWSKCRTNSNF